MRSVTAGLALLTAAAQLTLFAVAERQLRSLGVPGVADPLWLRALWGGVGAAVWCVGAGLRLVGRTQSAAVVLLTNAALLLVGALAGLGAAVTGTPLADITDLTAATVRFGGALVWLLAAATAVAAWRDWSPRAAWRGARPGADGRSRAAGGGYGACAVLAWLPSVFTTTAMAPPGAPRSFITLEVTGDVGLAAAAGILTPVVLAALLWVAPRLQATLGGVLVLTMMVPTLITGSSEVVGVFTEPFRIFTPAGVLGIIGTLGVTIIAAGWIVRGRPEGHIAAT